MFCNADIIVMLSFFLEAQFLDSDLQLYMHGTFFITWEAFWQLGLATVISPDLVANKAKSDDFDTWPDLRLTCYLFKKVFQVPLKGTC